MYILPQVIKYFCVLSVGVPPSTQFYEPLPSFCVLHVVISRPCRFYLLFLQLSPPIYYLFHHSLSYHHLSQAAVASLHHLMAFCLSSNHFSRVNSSKVLIVSEILMKTTVRCHFMSTRMARIIKSDNNKC